MQAVHRTALIVDAMLAHLQRGLEEPDWFTSPECEQLFGSGQSMIINLQKLVQALSALSQNLPTDESTRGRDNQEVSNLSSEEMRLLAVWLSEHPPAE